MRGLLPAVALLLAALAGCSSPDGPEAGPEPDPIVITDPRDLANGTAPGSHVHDYWQGRDRVEVVTDDWNGGVSYGGSDHGTIGWFRPADGSIVPQGAGVIEGVADWQAEEPDPVEAALGAGSDFDRMELWVKTAADGEAQPVTRLEDGVPFRFNTTNAQDDPPHYVLSLWEFHVVAFKDGADGVSFSGSIAFKAEALRTLPLAVFPPHPDPWNGTTELQLAQVDMQVDLHTGLVFSYFCYGGCADHTFGPDAGKTVPFDAAAIEVTIATDTGSTPIPLDLTWHGADTRTLQPAEPESESPGLRTYRLEVEPGLGDSPYASQSLWEFRVHMDDTEDQGAWRGTYHVTVKAMR